MYVQSIVLLRGALVCESVCLCVCMCVCVCSLHTRRHTRQPIALYIYVDQSHTVKHQCATCPTLFSQYHITRTICVVVCWDNKRNSDTRIAIVVVCAPVYGTFCDDRL
jgi:hypothetical protein